MTRPHDSPPGKQAGRRGASKRTTPESPKAAHIVELVHALSGELGLQDGVYLGRRLSRLLADAYEERRRPVPRWVQQLLTHYTGKGRGQ